MITILLILAILTIITIFNYKTWNNKLGGERIAYSLFGIFFGGALSFLVCMFFLIAIQNSNWEVEISRVDKSKPIYSLKTSDSVSGSFLLGSRSVSTYEYYRTFVKQPRGSYTRFEVSVDDAELILDDEQAPQIKWREITYRLPKWFVFWNVDRIHKTKYDLVVPLNTIIQKF